MKTSRPFTESVVLKSLKWDVESAALALCCRYRQIIQSNTELFVEMGLILVEIERRELWKYDSRPMLDEPPFHSFNDWVKRASGTSNGTAYEALEAAKTLSHIPVEERNGIPRCNQKVLAKLSPAVSGSPSVKKTAKEKSNDELLQKIQREFPEQHIEVRRPMRFSPELSAREVIDKALEIAMAIEQCGREEALEAICQLYIEENIYEYNEKRTIPTGKGIQ